MHLRLFKRIFIVGLLTYLFVSQTVAQPINQPRRLAPGVLTEIPSNIQERETFSGPKKLEHLPTIQFTPNYVAKSETLFERSKLVTFRRPVWELDFAFKPLRMTVASIPQANGKLRRVPILYMVYRIRNNGKALRQTEQPDGSFRSEEVNVASLSGHPTAQRFVPRFVLEGWVYNADTREYEKKTYMDQIIPGALRTIQDREIIPPAKPMLRDENGKPVLGPDGKPLLLLNSAQIAQVNPIPVTTETDDNSVWGVVTWKGWDPAAVNNPAIKQGLDPRVDYMSIYIQGLTNAFRYSESVDGKSNYTQKTLQLNWWRPGDSFNEADDRIYYGVPLVKDQRKQVKILGLYQVPGPSLSVFETTEVATPPALIRPSQTTGPGTGERTNLVRHLFDVELPVNAKLEVPTRLQLDDPGKLPASVLQEFAAVGIEVPADTRLTTETPKNIWSCSVTVDGQKRFFRLFYEPRYWDIYQDRVEFRGRVEHLWVYR